VNNTSFGTIIIAGIIASIAIFAVLVIQNKILVVGEWGSILSGTETLVAPMIIGAAVFVTVFGKLQSS